MKPSLLTLAFQDPDSSMIIVIAIVLLLLFFVVVIVAIGLIIFFVMRKRKKAALAAALPSSPSSSEAALAAAAPSYSPEPAYSSEAAAVVPEAAVAVDAPPPVFEAPTPVEEMRVDSAEAAQPPAADYGSLDFDPSRTVAITRENTVTISYGYIKFVSGVLAGQQFDVDPEGAYIGREGSLSQIVVPDPRISKRHLWIGVRDGLVKILDQDSRNGTFVNDPKSERITESTLTSGDTVILGESDVARFEYHA